MKNAMKQMALFTLLANVIGVVSGLIYGGMFALMYVCVPLVIGIAFVVRTIRGTGKE